MSETTLYMYYYNKLPVVVALHLPWVAASSIQEILRVVLMGLIGDEFRLQRWDICPGTLPASTVA